MNLQRSLRLPVSSLLRSCSQRSSYSTQPINLSARNSDLLDLSNLPEELLSTLHLEPTDLLIYPAFFTASEQRILLSASLAKLNAAANSVSDRRQKKHWLSTLSAEDKKRLDHRSFWPDAAYLFQEGHFDGVYVVRPMSYTQN